MTERAQLHWCAKFIRIHLLELGPPFTLNSMRLARIISEKSEIKMWVQRMVLPTRFCQRKNYLLLVKLDLLFMSWIFDSSF